MWPHNNFSALTPDKQNMLYRMGTLKRKRQHMGLPPAIPAMTSPMRVMPPMQALATGGEAMSRADRVRSLLQSRGGAKPYAKAMPFKRINGPVPSASGDSPTGDNTPAMLSGPTKPGDPPEFVLNKGAVLNMGLDKLHAENARGLQHLAAPAGKPVASGMPGMWKGGEGGSPPEGFIHAGGPGSGWINPNEVYGGNSVEPAWLQGNIPGSGYVNDTSGLPFDPHFFGGPNYHQQQVETPTGTMPDASTAGNPPVPPMSDIPGWNAQGGNTGGGHHGRSGGTHAANVSGDFAAPEHQFSPHDLGYSGPMGGLGLIGEYFNPGGSPYWGTGTAGGTSWYKVRSH